MPARSPAGLNSASTSFPFWQAYTPAAHNEVVTTGGEPYEARIGGGTYTGVSVTPRHLPMELQTRISTIHALGTSCWRSDLHHPQIPPERLRFPKEHPAGPQSSTFPRRAEPVSTISPGPRRSIDFALNAEHISSASLGDRNPGVNASLQMQIGYTWWK